MTHASTTPPEDKKKASQWTEYLTVLLKLVLKHFGALQTLPRLKMCIVQLFVAPTISLVDGGNCRSYVECMHVLRQMCCIYLVCLLKFWIFYTQDCYMYLILVLMPESHLIPNSSRLAHVVSSETISSTRRSSLIVSVMSYLVIVCVPSAKVLEANKSTFSLPRTPTWADQYIQSQDF